VQVADHELSSADFEGVHLGHIRGSGAAIIWDEGYVTVLRNEPDHVSFVLQGHKSTGALA